MPDLHQAISATPNPDRAATACRQLIRAYLRDPEHVDWDDVQLALEAALAAFGLPPDAIDSADGREPEPG